MLDSIFYFMAKDKYADWRVHVRKCSSGGNIEFNVPHFYCDGRTLLRQIPPALIGLSSNHSTFDIASSSLMQIESKNIVKPKENQTYFQAMLAKLIELHQWPDEATVALAVDISSSLDSNYKSQGNQVAFPIYQISELITLCNAPKKVWVEEINKKAIGEFENYRRIGAKLPDISVERRLMLYEKMPLHSAQAIISYFGPINRFIDHQECILKTFDFAASTTRGPKQTILGYTIGDDTFFRTINENQIFDWNLPVKVFQRDEAKL